MTFLKLLNFEVNRFAKFFAVLAGLTIVCQIASVAISSNNMAEEAFRQMKEENLSVKQYLDKEPLFTFSNLQSDLLYMAPVMLSICALILYVFLIWYRDWFAGSPFIYRLLMIPGSRMNVYFSKICTIVLMVFGLIALQMLLLPAEHLIFQSIIPENLRASSLMGERYSGSVNYLNILLPHTFQEFVIYYLAGVTFVLVMTTGILFERSYRWPGVGYAVLYGISTCLIIGLPMYISVRTNYFYGSELVYISITSLLAASFISIAVSRKLIRSKITV
ncbi:hypothetical protein GKZ89_15410 [Bacillus mangrovi]|uniref:Uncharacterized protein n=1 Tax=Metabacillus mangrovi TaxID=1491830 RepID=A0A7X2S7U8_9BACI|nr:hypothetical protein [Metabacillus mangrovi]MTH54791.1 hypothetical protein [Metabacillus mangrovi]